MLLLGEHEDSEDELGRQDRLDEDASHNASVRGECCVNIQWHRELDTDEIRGEDTTTKLRYDENAASSKRQKVRHQHCDRDRGVEEAAADAEQDPYVDHQTEGED
jgi:hypothetical protein